MLINNISENNFNWICEQQRRRLEEARRMAREDPKCDTKSFAQQPARTYIGGNPWCLKENHLIGVERREQLADAEWQNLQIIHDEHGRIAKQHDLYRRDERVRCPPKAAEKRPSVRQAPACLYHWTREQHQHGSRQNKKDIAPDLLNTAARSTIRYQDDLPPPYEERPARCSAPSSHVQMARTLDSTCASTVPSMSRRRKEVKKEVVGLSRKRSNRTAM
jgi:hypothetical protein